METEPEIAGKILTQTTSWPLAHGGAKLGFWHVFTRAKSFLTT